MASKKKSVVRKRRSSKKAQTSRFKRFFRALAVSAITSFGAASCVLNPQLREQIQLEPVLEQLGLPVQDAPQVLATGPQAQTNFSQCREFFPNGRPPIVPSGPALRELCYSSFAILHSGKSRTPVFVAQRLNRQMLMQGKNIERTDRFYPEARLPSSERAELDDYRGSGYSRGHMAPAGDMHTLDAMAQSFSLANMVPQDQRQNSGPWNKIEQDTRKYILRARGDVYVFTGPVYTGRSAAIGGGRVAVPSYLYKLVYDATTGKSWVHWQPNSREAKVGPPISYEEFVGRTGLRLL
ncbi:DNA/RNA non-specific endonuclease [Pusillimonas sp. MFBS29]|uniref:DNA/RNA non-specific endonuclease n=1 Tax=Pusillimonas sp. MFBS29 TaxID=2886690 RepID=UPI001D0FD2DC|nr:DNA/RNA non-specific endonuclease [Pusillimonas sp. MFBS29]MCC2597684.1 DNA/RNA non-specific endonuclease [Pusillimonas sp. MFBS29]